MEFRHKGCGGKIPGYCNSVNNRPGGSFYPGNLLEIEALIPTCPAPAVSPG